MYLKTETRRTGRCGRAPDVSIAADNSEYSPQTQNHQQIAWLLARYDVGYAHARALAEQAFSRRPQR